MMRDKPPFRADHVGSLLRTAPVSSEMVLNYVAEHSLGLPKSY